MSVAAFAPGTMMIADLPCIKKDGPVGTGRVVTDELDLVLLADRTPLSSSANYCALASAVHLLLSSGGAGSADDPHEYMLLAGQAFHKRMTLAPRNMLLQ